MVVAESRYLAEDALDGIVVDYEPLPAVTTIEQALEAQSRRTHFGLSSNVVSERAFCYGEPAAVLLTQRSASVSKSTIRATSPRRWVWRRDRRALPATESGDEPAAAMR